MNFAKKCRELRMKKAATQEQMAAALYNRKAGEYRKKADRYVSCQPF